MEIKIKALKQIASEIGVTLRLEQEPVLINKVRAPCLKKKSHYALNCDIDTETNFVTLFQDKLNVERRQDEREIRKNSVDDHHNKVNIQNNPEKTIQHELVSNRNEERKRHTDTAAAAEKALESESFEIEVNKHSNHAIELKASERREIKTLAWEDFQLSLNPRDKMTAISKNAVLISEEHAEEANREDNNDHNSNSDAATENEHFKSNEERVYASSNAIKWNSQRSQSDPTQHPLAARHVMETSNHEHVDWKMMSVRSRWSKGD